MEKTESQKIISKPLYEVLIASYKQFKFFYKEEINYHQKRELRAPKH